MVGGDCAVGDRRLFCLCAVPLDRRRCADRRGPAPGRGAFEHYLNPEVIASVLDDPRGLRLSGERRHLAILFADIVNFTSRTERAEPERLVALLNAYMTEMTKTIFECLGVVDKLLGER